jgi:hypothetical protein
MFGWQISSGWQKSSCLTCPDPMNALAFRVHARFTGTVIQKYRVSSLVSWCRVTGVPDWSPILSLPVVSQIVSLCHFAQLSPSPSTLYHPGDTGVPDCFAVSFCPIVTFSFLSLPSWWHWCPRLFCCLILPNCHLLPSSLYHPGDTGVPDCFAVSFCPIVTFSLPLSTILVTLVSQIVLLCHSAQLSFCPILKSPSGWFEMIDQLAKLQWRILAADHVWHSNGRLLDVFLKEGDRTIVNSPFTLFLVLALESWVRVRYTEIGLAVAYLLCYLFSHSMGILPVAFWHQVKNRLYVTTEGLHPWCSRNNPISTDNPQFLSPFESPATHPTPQKSLTGRCHLAW